MENEEVKMELLEKENLWKDNIMKNEKKKRINKYNINKTMVNWKWLFHGENARRKIAINGKNFNLTFVSLDNELRVQNFPTCLLLPANPFRAHPAPSARPVRPVCPVFLKHYNSRKKMEKIEQENGASSSRE